MHPAGIALAAILIALLSLGGEAAQITLQLPKAISQVFQGMLLMFLLGCDFLVRYRVQWRTASAVAA
jgi:simple sugar transport system permease protein